MYKGSNEFISLLGNIETDLYIESTKKLYSMEKVMFKDFHENDLILVPYKTKVYPGYFFKKKDMDIMKPALNNKLPAHTLQAIFNDPKMEYIRLKEIT